MDVLEPGALGQHAELTVAVFTVQLLGLTVAHALRRRNERTANQNVPLLLERVLLLPL